jgi:hypothetical protein
VWFGNFGSDRGQSGNPADIVDRLKTRCVRHREVSKSAAIGGKADMTPTSLDVAV